MVGFSWVDADVLAAMPRPRGDDLLGLADEGIDLLVSLTEVPLDPADLDAAGLDTLHLPIEDFHPPTYEQMVAFVDAVEARRDAGEQVGVHCTAGRGRSGTLAAVWFVHNGMTGEEAIAHIRALRPGSIETAAQEEAVHFYYDALDAP
jgi:atypical dual specificity phosphatase